MQTTAGPTRWTARGDSRRGRSPTQTASAPTSKRSSGRREFHSTNTCCPDMISCCSANRCQGRASCTVGSSTGELNFGTDPCGGTYKFLEFQYTCVEEDPEVLFELVCEGMTLALSCSDGQVANEILFVLSFILCISLYRGLTSYRPTMAGPPQMSVLPRGRMNCALQRGL